MNHREPIPCRHSYGCLNPTRCTLADECSLEPITAGQFAQSPDFAGAVAYQLTKRLVIDMPTARAAVDAALHDNAVAVSVHKQRYEHAPHLCIAPACGRECSGCNSAISPETMRKNAIRYAMLQRMDPRFGMPTAWLSFKTLDEAVDSELARLATTPN